jgi:hypothetical protein
MIVVIRSRGLANGMHCTTDGQWLKSFDPDAHAGRGDAVFTDRIEHALKFASKVDAMAFWNTQSKVRPLRPDGRPNKPLTAFTVEIETLVTGS